MYDKNPFNKVRDSFFEDPSKFNDEIDANYGNLTVQLPNDYYCYIFLKHVQGNETITVERLVKHKLAFYVGKGHGDRCTDHIRLAVQKNTTDKEPKLRNRIIEEWDKGETVTIIKIATDLSYSQALMYEAVIISALRKSKLANGKIGDWNLLRDGNKLIKKKMENKYEEEIKVGLSILHRNLNKAMLTKLQYAKSSVANGNGCSLEEAVGYFLLIRAADATAYVVVDLVESATAFNNLVNQMLGIEHNNETDVADTFKILKLCVADQHVLFGDNLIEEFGQMNIGKQESIPNGTSVPNTKPYAVGPSIPQFDTSSDSAEPSSQAIVVTQMVERVIVLLGNPNNTISFLNSIVQCFLASKFVISKSFCQYNENNAFIRELVRLSSVAAGSVTTINVRGLQIAKRDATVQFIPFVMKLLNSLPPTLAAQFRTKHQKMQKCGGCPEKPIGRARSHSVIRMDTAEPSIATTEFATLFKDIFGKKSMRSKCEFCKQTYMSYTSVTVPKKCNRLLIALPGGRRINKSPQIEVKLFDVDWVLASAVHFSKNHYKTYVKTSDGCCIVDDDKPVPESNGLPNSLTGIRLLWFDRKKLFD